MYNVNNPRHKLNPQQVKELQRYFEDEGWRLNWLSVFFRVHRSSIIFHIRFNGWVRRMKVLKHMPKEIAEIYRQRKKDKYENKLRGSYDYIKRSTEQHRMNNCVHIRWVKRCSLCGEILGSDATHNH